MFFLSLLISSLIGLTAALDPESTSIGAVVVTPLDYSLYSETIDYQLLRYKTDGTVFFCDKLNTPTNTNTTLTVRDAAILSDGQFRVDADTDDYYLTVAEGTGVVNVSTDGTTTNGIYYIEDKTLFYSYHSTFIACEFKTGVYSLLWRESDGSCDNDNWLLVKLQTYGSSSGAVSAYFPDGYKTAIAATATENVYTTTVGEPSSTSADSSSTSASTANGAARAAVGLGAIGAAAIALF